LDACSDKLGFAHEAGTKGAFLNPIRRATNVDVYFIVAHGLSHRRTLGHCCRVIAAKLQRNRVLAVVEVKEVELFAMKQGASRHHFSEQQ
jgi:hypothetical protein